MHLIDAGLFLDSPYPSVLREARDVDVIVSFDFSEDDPFGVNKEKVESRVLSHVLEIQSAQYRPVKCVY